MHPTRLVILAAAVVPTLAAAQTRQSGSAIAVHDPKGWDVPFANSRPRDPYADHQGRVWFVGQTGNYIAYLDPKNGAFKRFEIEPGTNPHNLVVEKGTVWFTGNRNNRLVKLDPRTGTFTTYMIPDSTVRDPHTMVFDPTSGVAWFTAQNAGVVGRFDPRTEQFRLWKTGERTRPYGIVIDSKGNPWFDLFGTNKLGTIDAETGEMRMVALPDERARPRRIAITSDDQVYYGDYTRGFLGHLDPKSGKVQEWALPAAGKSLPYAMTSDDRDVVWVAQQGYDGEPATLVAFDHRTKRFTTTVPVGRPAPNTIRHMTFDKASRLIWFGTDQGSIGRISVPPPAPVP